MSAFAPCVDLTREGADEALAERLFESAVGALELFGVYLGRQLGLYAALDAGGPQNSTDLAKRAGVAERYAREWLEQQAVAGLLAVDEGRDAKARRYQLPDAHRAVLLAAEEPTSVAPLADMIVGVAGALPDVLAAYRSGGGVPYERYGADFRRGQGDINRPLFSRSLGAEWLPALGPLHERLVQQGGRIADLGCGQGWSTVALAAAYPKATVSGFDADAASIDEASRIAAERGVGATFHCADAAELAAHGPFDLVWIFEALHDMAHPTEVLRAVRPALAPQGALVVADERVAHHFSAPGDLLERTMYGWSISHCLPASMTEADSEAIGTAIRPATVERCARRAGYRHFEVLPIEAEFFRFYRLADD